MIGGRSESVNRDRFPPFGEPIVAIAAESRATDDDADRAFADARRTWARTFTTTPGNSCPPR